MPERIETYLRNDFYQSVNRFSLRFKKQMLEGQYEKAKSEKHKLTTSIKIIFLTFILLFTARRTGNFIKVILGASAIPTFFIFELVVLILWGVVLLIEMTIYYTGILSQIKGCTFLLYDLIATIVASYMYYDTAPVLSPM